MLSSDYIVHLIAILIFLGVSATFYWPHLEGKQVRQSDLIQYQGMTQEVLEFEEKIGRRPLWTNSMFGGMPTYQINPPDRGNYLNWVNQVLQLGSENPIGIMFTGMIGFYILLFALRVDWWIAIIGSIAFGLSTYNIILFESGHITKLKAISFLPLLTAGLILAYRGRIWWGFFLFGLGFGLNLMANHVQMTYYFFLTVPIFLGATLINALRESNISTYLKATGAIGLAVILALCSSLSNLWPTYEYSKETIRGNIILDERSDQFHDTITRTPAKSGLEWDFAMEWSNGMIDLLTCYIPGAAGSSSQARLFSDTKLYQELADQSVQHIDSYKAPMYWGNLPFTNGPPYFGAVIL
ncbi:MAG: hypothetical protein OEM26_06380, partial [Saprospiraceae bacterium]|nr:hypothetical protein [Saprospiraceae bacterium]